MLHISDAERVFSLVAGSTTLGSEGTDIPLQGPGIAAQHCYIENKAGCITLYPCGNQCCVDGLPITKPYRLTQGRLVFTDKLIIVTFCFRPHKSATKVKRQSVTEMFLCTVAHWKGLASLNETET